MQSRQPNDMVPESMSVWDRYEQVKEIGEGSYGRYVKP